MFKNSILIFFLALTTVIMADPEKRLYAVPLSVSCGIYFETPDLSTKCNMVFREKGKDDWNKTFELVGIPAKDIADGDTAKSVYSDKSMFRGSIVNLKENTTYEVRLTQGGESFFIEFTTWSPAPPIKKTVNISDHDGRSFVITEKGNPDGWIKYVSDGKTLVSTGNSRNAAISIVNSEYVIIEGLKTEGGMRHGISIENSQNIRVVNCDISDYGRIGKKDASKDGKYYTPEGIAINYDAGINILNSGNIVIERNYIHDPHGTANSWQDSHPAGPSALVVQSTGGLVLRYNDFIGNDKQRWNDVIEGSRNGSPTGGFFRDAEIYGNMFIFSNDDGIELDGGEMNIRIFLNKFEGSLCGISTGPCLLGPSYLFNNLLVNLEDENGKAGWAFKNGHQNYDRGRIFIMNNTLFCRRAYGHYNVSEKDLIKYGHELKGFSRNNIFSVSDVLFHTSVFQRKNDLDYDLLYSSNTASLEQSKKSLLDSGMEKHGIFKKPEFTGADSGIFSLKPDSPGYSDGIFIDNFTEAMGESKPVCGACQKNKSFNLPFRPTALSLDKYQLNFSIPAPEASCPAQYIKASGISGEEFKIMKSKSIDWFDVEPASGVLDGNGTLCFKVSLIKNNTMAPGIYRGLFLIRLKNGLSRPVTIYAKVGNIN